jgi:zinc protease
MKRFASRLLAFGLVGSSLLLGGCFLIVGDEKDWLRTEDVDSGVRATSASAPSHTASSAAAPSAGDSTGRSVDRGGAFPYPVVSETLANGLSINVVPMPSEGLVSYWSIVRTGSRDEVEPGVTGFAHFFEHVMFRGTETRPGPEYDRVVNGMGADANAFTDDDITAYHLNFAKEDLATVVEIESDRFQNLKYDETQFRTEAGAVYGEYRKGKTNPFLVLFEALVNEAFEAHTYKHTTIGFEADIVAMPEQFEYSKSFFQRFYRPENVVILVVGDVEPRSTIELVKSKYAGWKKGYEAPKVPVEPPQTAQKRIDVSFEGQTLPWLCVSFKGERFLPGDVKMMAATTIAELAFGETSPLYEKLVLDEQRCESLFAFFGANRDPGLWSIIAIVKEPGDVAAVEGEIWDTVERLRRELPSQTELDDARSRGKFAFLSGLATPDQVCNSVARIVAMTGSLDAVDRQFETLARVTPADVQAAAATWLRPERATVAVLHTAQEPIPSAATGAEPPVLMPVATDPNVSIQLWFKVGSQDDPPGKEGLAALTGALLSGGGTRSRAYEELLAELFPLAAGYGVSVDKEMSVFAGGAHRDALAAFYPIFSDAVLNPGFRAEDFERLKDVAISSIENDLRYSSDEELGKAALLARVFDATPYAHIETGTVGSLRGITLADVEAFWHEHYTRDNVVIGLAGGYPGELEGRIPADLARLAPGRPASTPAPAPAAIAGRQVLLVEKPGNTTAISFGFPIDVQRGTREFYALWIANSWLGEHRNSSSHLYQVIREARGMNYGDYSYIEAYPNGGQRSMPPTGVGRRAQMFEVWIRPVADASAVFALRAALREVEKLATQGMDREAFEFTKRFLAKYSLHFAETSADRLGYALDDSFYGLDESHLARFRRMMEEITLEEVNAAIAKHLQVDDMVIAMVTADAQGLKAKLVSDAASPIDYGAIEKPAEILAEDAEIQRYPLRIRGEDVEIVPVDQMFESSGSRP